GTRQAMHACSAIVGRGEGELAGHGARTRHGPCNTRANRHTGPLGDPTRRLLAVRMSDSILLPIEIPTLALSRGLMQVMLAGLIMYVGGRHQRAGGARLWVVAFLLNGISPFLFVLRLPEPWQAV